MSFWRQSARFCLYERFLCTSPCPVEVCYDTSLLTCSCAPARSRLFSVTSRSRQASFVHLSQPPLLSPASAYSSQTIAGCSWDFRGCTDTDCGTFASLLPAHAALYLAQRSPSLHHPGKLSGATCAHKPTDRRTASLPTIAVPSHDFQSTLLCDACRDTILHKHHGEEG